MKQYDAILCLDTNINEGLSEYDYGISDIRAVSDKPGSQTKAIKVGLDWDNPKLYANFSFGNRLQSGLNSMGSGYSSIVTDFGKWVTAEVFYHDKITGRTASKIFLIVFKEKGNGYVLSTHNRYRSISGVEQAVSYIRSVCSSLPNGTQTKIG